MTRVLVGMSGGVDSSVAAALLARAGHEVVGVSLQLYDHSEGGRAARCCSPEDFLDARRVAERFGFPYYVINKEDAFGRRVLDYFVEEYGRGRTPNPCVRCNADVKFETLAGMARALGAHAVATGHYARVWDDPVSGRRRLLCAADAGKDQSYFLFDVAAEHLRLAIFPLGGMSKEQVRAEAALLGLPNADKPDSQDVCFVEGGDYREFLRRAAARDGRATAGESQGEMVDMAGRTLGRHAGLSSYTVGQRRGLGVASSRRLYVVQVDPVSNRVVLGGKDDLMVERLELTGVRYAEGGPPAGDPARRAGGDGGFRANVRVRYRHTGAAALVEPGPDGRASIRFDEPQVGVSPGQAAVFYDGDAVIGGGWIDLLHRAGASVDRPAPAEEDETARARAPVSAPEPPVARSRARIA